MALKSVVETLDGLDPVIAALYVKGDDGKFNLPVDGFVPKAKLDEFRSNNVQLLKDLERFKNVDPEKYEKLLAEQAKDAEKKLIDEGELDKVLEQRTIKMREEFANKESGLSQNITSLNKQLESLLIDNEVRATAIRVGIRPSAVDDVLLRAKTIFSVKSGQAVPLTSKGEVIYGKDGVNPMSVSDWMTSLKDNADHLFVSSTGGGSQGSRNGPGAGANASSVDKISSGLAKLR